MLTEKELDLADEIANKILATPKMQKDINATIKFVAHSGDYDKNELAWKDLAYKGLKCLNITIEDKYIPSVTEIMYDLLADDVDAEASK